MKVGGFAQAITGWGEKGITFTMFNAGSATGPWNVTVTTGEGAVSVPGTFTFVP